MIESATVNIFALILMRMSGCIFLNPIFSRRNIPNIMKVGLSLGLSIVVMGFTTVAAPPMNTLFEYMVLLLKEFLIGFIIGFVVSLFNYAITFGGEIMDMQMGLSMSKMYDAASNASLSFNGTFFNILFMLLFIAAGGHITLIHLFLISGEMVPYGQMALGPDISMTIIDLFCQCTVLAVKFALPVIAVEMVVEMGIGIIMKAVPQINVFVVNLQAKLFIGIVILVLLFVPFSNFVERVITLLFDAIQQLISAMA